MLSWAWCIRARKNETTVPDLRIGIQTASLRQPLRRALESAGRIEADGVQVDLRHELPLADCSATALREIRKRLDDFGLKLASASYPTRRGYGAQADLDRRLTATMQAMTVAAQLGTRVVSVDIGPLSAEGDEPSPTLLESLTALARHGDHVGARLAAKTVSEPPRALANLIDHLPEGALAIDFQPAELLRNGHDTNEALSLLASQVSHVTAADAVHDLSARQVIETPLGRGSVDYVSLLAGLESHGYRGWITIKRSESPQPVAEMGNAVAYLRNVIRDG